MKRMFSLVLVLFATALMAVDYPPDLPPRGPILTTAAIVNVMDGKGECQGVLLIRRGKEPFGYALPGGKVEYGESVETAVRRELMEETGVQLNNLSQYHVYSNPQRDPRWHSVEVTFFASTTDQPRAGDDAAEVIVCPYDRIPFDQMVFDHAEILRDLIGKPGGKFGSLNPTGSGGLNMKRMIHP